MFMVGESVYEDKEYIKQSNPESLFKTLNLLDPSIKLNATILCDTIKGVKDIKIYSPNDFMLFLDPSDTIWDEKNIKYKGRYITIEKAGLDHKSPFVHLEYQDYDSFLIAMGELSDYIYDRTNKQCLYGDLGTARKNLNTYSIKGYNQKLIDAIKHDFSSLKDQGKSIEDIENILKLEIIPWAKKSFTFPLDIILNGYYERFAQIIYDNNLQHISVYMYIKKIIDKYAQTKILLTYDQFLDDFTELINGDNSSNKGISYFSQGNSL